MRLTNEIRYRLCDKLIKRSYNSKLKKIHDNIKKVAAEAIEETFGEEIAKIKKVANDPTLYIKTASSIEVEDAWYNKKWSGNSHDYINIDSYEIPANIYRAKFDTKSTRLTKTKVEKVVSLYESERVMRDEMKKVRNELESQLKSVTTVKKLTDTWPEIVSDLDEVLKEIGQSPLLPSVVDHTELNKKLDLPPKQEK